MDTKNCRCKIGGQKETTGPEERVRPERQFETKSEAEQTEVGWSCGAYGGKEAPKTGDGLNIRRQETERKTKAEMGGLRGARSKTSGSGGRVANRGEGSKGMESDGAQDHAVMELRGAFKFK